MSLGNNIKQFRKELGITQEELAARLFVTSQAVSKWESGAGLPDTAQIVPLAKALSYGNEEFSKRGKRAYRKRKAQCTFKTSC